MRYVVVAGAVVMALLTGAGSAVAADPPGIALDPSEDNNAVDVTGNQSGSEQTEPTDPSRPVYTVPEPYKDYLYVPTCSGNDIEVTDDDEVESIGDNLCLGATDVCPVRGDIRYNVFRLQYEADGSVRDGARPEPAGMQCRGPDDPPEGGPVQIMVADIADQAREAAPETVVNVEPVDRSYVNLPTNFYADAGAVDATVAVLGQDIGLRFEPSGFAWAYGDGSSGSGAGVAGSKVGGPGSVEHAYRRSGDVSVTLTRTFDVTYTLPGGQTGTLPAPGVSNISDPYPLQIREIQATVTETS